MNNNHPLFQLGLVCFRLRGSDKINEKLLSAINESGKLHMVPALVNDKYIIRFCAVAQNAADEDIDLAWEIIVDFTNEIIEKDQADELTEIIEKKKKETLAQKRSFFVRMVSDPKIYNPAINKVGTPRTSNDLVSSHNEGITPLIRAPSKDSSWISWPLGFLFNPTENDGQKSNVSLR